MSGLKIAFPLFAVTILLVPPAEAGISYYVGASAESTFNGALGSLTLLNPVLTFSSGDLAPGGLFNANGTGIDFLGFDDFFFNNPVDLTVSSGKLTATAPSEVIKITFPSAGIYALGFHITLTSGFGNWCIGFTSGGCDSNPNGSTVQFYGFISDAPITSPLYLRPLGGAQTTVLPDFEAYSVPEDSSLLLVGLGLISLVLARRKTRSA